MIILPFYNNVAFIFISLLSSYEKERPLILPCGYLVCVTTTVSTSLGAALLFPLNIFL